uniref:UBC core domain-containing protein n=1 Tax=Leptobrachium leishanense TaxID=445787 RepID=A0A8C5PWF2_9ANUR
MTANIRSTGVRNPAVKLLMKEAAELRDPTDHYHAQPLEDNLFEWHFTVRGPPDSDFDGSIYHGKIVLPPEYPMKPPRKKISLSISGHHPETWQPSWSIRTALLAIIGFMPTKGEGAIDSLDYTPEERKTLAKKSQEFCCEACGVNMKALFVPQMLPGAQDRVGHYNHRDWFLPHQASSRSSHMVLMGATLEHCTYCRANPSTRSPYFP